jgi:predicted nucleic acid-binding protein
MDIVVDTTAVIAVVTNEPHKAAIVRATSGAVLLAPPSLPWEVGNAFSAMFKRRRLGIDQARAAFREYLQIPIQLSEISGEVAIELAARLSIYAYDAYILACAIKHAAPLLTLDEGLRSAAGKTGVQTLEVKP